MTSAAYRVSTSDAAGDRSRLAMRPKFHRDSICTVPFAKLLLLLSLIVLFTFQTKAQNPPPPPPAEPVAPEPAPPGPLLNEKQLENLVSRIALYPDPLLAQVSD